MEGVINRTHLKRVCKEEGSLADYELISNLLELHKKKALMIKKRGLKDDIERAIESHI